MDKSFERKYSIDFQRLKSGAHAYTFHIDQSFFAAFPHSPIREADVKVDVLLHKYASHADVNFTFSGTITLACDRCLEEYPHAFSATARIIYSHDARMESEGEDIVFVDPSIDILSFVQELYDFICLQIPIRRIPPMDIHRCPDEVYRLLGIDPETGRSLNGDDEDDVIEPVNDEEE